MKARDSSTSAAGGTGSEKRWMRAGIIGTISAHDRVARATRLSGRESDASGAVGGSASANRGVISSSESIQAHLTAPASPSALLRLDAREVHSSRSPLVASSRSASRTARASFTLSLKMSGLKRHLARSFFGSCRHRQCLLVGEGVVCARHVHRTHGEKEVQDLLAHGRVGHELRHTFGEPLTLGLGLCGGFLVRILHHQRVRRSCRARENLQKGWSDSQAASSAANESAVEICDSAIRSVAAAS